MKITLENLKSIISDTMGEQLAERAEKSRRDAEQRANAGRSDQRTAPNMASKSKAGRQLRYIAQAKRDNCAPIDIANRHGDKEMVDEIEKSMQSGLSTQGGSWVVGGVSEEILEAARPMAVVRGSGVQDAPLINGSWTQPYEDTGPTATYSGESTNVTATESTSGKLHLTAKKLIAQVPVSNEFIDDTSGRGDVFVKNSLARALAIREDLAFLRGDGTSAQPRGMKSWADDNSATNVISANTTVTVATVTTELSDIVRAIEENDVPIMNGVFIFDARTKHYLRTARDGNNNLVWAAELNEGRLMGFPWRSTTQIPNNLGGSSIDSEVYFAATDWQVIADEANIQVDVVPYGVWYDGSNLQSGLSRDETVIIAKARHDYGCLYRGKAVAYLDTVRYGN